MTWKQKILKTIFYLSFIPYLIATLVFISGMIWGVDIIFGVAKGRDALAILAGAALFYSPIFLCCLIYQIAFKILTRKNPEYQQYNTKKFFLVTSMVVVVCIVGITVIRFCLQRYDNHAYHERGYSEAEVIVVPYGEEYDNWINRASVVDHDELLSFLDKHADDLHGCKEKYQNYYTSYLIAVSPILSGTVEVYGEPELAISDGQQKARITTEYELDQNENDQYLMIVIIDSPGSDNFEIDTIWKEHISNY